MAITITFLEPGTDATQDVTSLWTTVAGAVTSDTSQAHTGPRSIKLTTSSPATTASVTVNSVLNDLGRRISFWLRAGDGISTSGRC